MYFALFLLAKCIVLLHKKGQSKNSNASTFLYLKFLKLFKKELERAFLVLLKILFQFY